MLKNEWMHEFNKWLWISFETIRAEARKKRTPLFEVKVRDLISARFEPLTFWLTRFWFSDKDNDL